jgi:hypothetical protein
MLLLLLKRNPSFVVQHHILLLICLLKNYIMAKFAQLKSIIENAEHDAEKFYKSGNHAAGTRLRKSLQQIKTLAQEVRQEVTLLKNKSE